MSRFLRESYQRLQPYTPGEQAQDKRWLKLNTNESPYPPAPQVIAAITPAEIADLRLYPDPDVRRLKAALAAAYQVKSENLFLANGSDDILNLAFMAFCGPDKAALYPEISYGFYAVYADLHQAQSRQIPLRADFTIDYRDYCHDEGFICLANPNAPTGLALSLEEIEAIVSSNPGHVVLIDEAYVDFGAESAIGLTAKYENLLVVQTFSKSRALAGARLGFAIANPALIADLERLRFATNPYSLNRLSLLAGEAAVSADTYYRERCRDIMETRAYTADVLQALGFTVTPSLTNFLFIQNALLPGETLYQQLKADGILIRHFSTEKITDYNRVTIGTRPQMDVFLEKVQAVLHHVKNANQSDERRKNTHDQC